MSKLEEVINDLNTFGFVDFYNGNSIVSVRKIEKEPVSYSVTFFGDKDVQKKFVKDATSIINDTLAYGYTAQIKYKRINSAMIGGAKIQPKASQDELIIALIRERQVSKCEIQFLKGFNPNGKPFYESIKSANPEIVDICIKYGARAIDNSISNGSKKTKNPLVELLKCAAKKSKSEQANCVKIFNSLIKSGNFDISQKDASGKNALSYINKLNKKGIKDYNHFVDKK